MRQAMLWLTAAAALHLAICAVTAKRQMPADRPGLGLSHLCVTAGSAIMVMLCINLVVPAAKSLPLHRISSEDVRASGWPLLHINLGAWPW